MHALSHAGPRPLPPNAVDASSGHDLRLAGLAAASLQLPPSAHTHSPLLAAAALQLNAALPARPRLPLHRAVASGPNPPCTASLPGDHRATTAHYPAAAPMWPAPSCSTALVGLGRRPHARCARNRLPR